MIDISPQGSNVLDSLNVFWLYTLSRRYDVPDVLAAPASPPCLTEKTPVTSRLTHLDLIWHEVRPRVTAYKITQCLCPRNGFLPLSFFLRIKHHRFSE
jgi:hypothetical protein